MNLQRGGLFFGMPKLMIFISMDSLLLICIIIKLAHPLNLVKNFFSDKWWLWLKNKKLFPYKTKNEIFYPSKFPSTK